MHRNLVDVLCEMHDGVADAKHLALTRAAALEVRVGDLPPDFTERGALLRVRDDDEVPVLRVARGRRLLREIQALLQNLAWDGPRQVEPFANRPRRGEKL